MYEAFQVCGFGPDNPCRYPASYGLPVSRKGVTQITQASDYSNSSCLRYKCPEDFSTTAFLWRKSSDPGTYQFLFQKGSFSRGAEAPLYPYSQSSVIPIHRGLRQSIYHLGSPGVKRQTLIANCRPSKRRQQQQR